MKLKHITITLAVAALTSCQLLKKNKLTLKRLNQMEELQVTEQRNTLSQQRQLVLIDSSQNDYTMMLWPKGYFKFSVANGFEGEAEKIMITGKHINQKILKVKDEIKQDSTLVKASYSKQKESSTIIKKNKTSLGFSWWWLLVLPLLYVGYKLYKRFKCPYSVTIFL